MISGNGVPCLPRPIENITTFGCTARLSRSAKAKADPLPGRPPWCGKTSVRARGSGISVRRRSSPASSISPVSNSAGVPLLTILMTTDIALADSGCPCRSVPPAPLIAISGVGLSISRFVSPRSNTAVDSVVSSTCTRTSPRARASWTATRNAAHSCVCRDGSAFRYIVRTKIRRSVNSARTPAIWSASAWEMRMASITSIPCCSKNSSSVSPQPASIITTPRSSCSTAQLACPTSRTLTLAKIFLRHGFRRGLKVLEIEVLGAFGSNIDHRNQERASRHQPP